MDKITFMSKDGLKLAGIWHSPIKPTHMAVLLSHGANVDKDEEGLFVRLAESLKNYGIAVFRFDFRGHGESEGDSVKMTIEDELYDLTSAMEQVIKKRYKNIGLLGTSFGGAIAALYAAKNPLQLKCLCLENPVLNYDHAFFTPVSPNFKKRIDDIQTSLTKNGWVVLSKRFNKKYGRQLFDEMKYLFPFRQLEKITIPTMIIHGDDDTRVPYADSKEYVSKLTKGKLVTIYGAEHGFHGEPFQTQAVNAIVDFFKTNL